MSIRNHELQKIKALQTIQFDGPSKIDSSSANIIDRFLNSSDLNLTFYFLGLAYFLFAHCHPATGITHIIQFCDLRLADMPWITDSETTVLTGISFLNLLRAAEMTFFSGYQPASLTLINFCRRFCCHSSFLLSLLTLLV
jgi:hypothetical protein